jgi:group I intron endonuclease
MIGIYKITSPLGKIYIGQSIDIDYRFYVYKKLKCKQQLRIYNSFLKYGVDNHVFEVIEECSVEFLNEKERYWQDYYNVLGKKGLNCILVSTNKCLKVLSKETKLKISNSLFGFKHTEESKGKISKGLTGRPVSQETRNKISESNKNKRPSAETRKKISLSLVGRKLSKECLEKRSKSISRGGSYKAKTVINLETGIFYDCIQDAADTININRSTLNNYLAGSRKNKTNFIYA